ncbi:MAG: amidohydrolase [Chloroflexi bacterium]|nr:amidohydrolase [Chloroflexota bacterium]
MRAIDIHVHPPDQPGSPPDPIMEQMRRYFRQTSPPPADPAEFAALFQKLDILAVLFPVNRETVDGRPFMGNDWVAEIVKQFPKQFITFCSVDPWTGRKAINELERCVGDLGARGLKVHPPGQGFAPNDHRFYPLWARCQELRIPVIAHSGHAARGAGMPGGAGVHLKYGDPMLWDDVAADFPELKIILAHPSWPWQSQQISICIHKANVYMDISGWSPKYFPAELVNEINSRIQDKVLFGSDHPFLSVERWLRDWEEVVAPKLKPEVKQKIMLDNARKLLGIP